MECSHLRLERCDTHSQRVDLGLECGRIERKAGWALRSWWSRRSRVTLGGSRTRLALGALLSLQPLRACRSRRPRRSVHTRRPLVSLEASRSLITLQAGQSRLSGLTWDARATGATLRPLWPLSARRTRGSSYLAAETELAAADGFVLHAGGTGNLAAESVEDTTDGDTAGGGDLALVRLAA